MLVYRAAQLVPVALPSVSLVLVLAFVVVVVLVVVVVFVVVVEAVDFVVEVVLVDETGDEVRDELVLSCEVTSVLFAGTVPLIRASCVKAKVMSVQLLGRQTLRGSSRLDARRQLRALLFTDTRVRDSYPALANPQCSEDDTVCTR